MSSKAFGDLPEEIIRWILAQKSLGPDHMGPFFRCRKTHFAACDVHNSQTDLVIKLNTNKDFPRDQHDFGLYGVAGSTRKDVLSGSDVEAHQGLYPHLASRKNVSFMMEIGGNCDANVRNLQRLKVFLENIRQKKLVLECIVIPQSSSTKNMEEFHRLMEMFPIGQNSQVELKINVKYSEIQSEMLEDFTIATEKVHSLNYMVNYAAPSLLSEPRIERAPFRISRTLQRLKLTLDHEFDLSLLEALPNSGIKVLEIQSVGLTVGRVNDVPLHEKFPYLEDLRLGSLQCGFIQMFPPSCRFQRLKVLHLAFSQRSNLEDVAFKKIAPNLMAVHLVDPVKMSHFSNTSKLA